MLSSKLSSCIIMDTFIENSYFLKDMGAEEMSWMVPFMTMIQTKDKILNKCQHTSIDIHPTIKTTQKTSMNIKSK